METPCIFHVDMDAFFVSVEELLDPTLRGKPVVVGAQPGHRGVVAAASYEARKYGIHSAMPVSQAVQLCPHAIFLPGHFGLYSKYSNRVHELLCRYSPIVEMVSIDEGYLDMTGSARMFYSPAASEPERDYRVAPDLSAREGESYPNRSGGGQRNDETTPRRPRSLALDPRNLLGVSIAWEGSEENSKESAEFNPSALLSLTRKKSDPVTSATPGASPFCVADRRIPGNLKSEFFMVSVAQRLRMEILKQTGLSASVGVGVSRLVAKVASALAKPRGIFFVVAGQEAALLAPLPIRRLPGIGPKTEKQLHDFGVWTVGDLQKLSAEFLSEHFGRWGESLALKARGRSDGRYEGEEDPKSISHENTFAVDTMDREEIEATLVYLIQRVGKRLRDHRLYTSTVQLKLRDSRFNTVTRAISLSEPTDIDAVILKHGLQLFREDWDQKTPVRLIGIGVSNLGDRGPHPKLMDGPRADQIEKLYHAADSLRDKYGFDVLKSPRGEKKRSH